MQLPIITNSDRNNKVFLVKNTNSGCENKNFPIGLRKLTNSSFKWIDNGELD